VDGLLDHLSTFPHPWPFPRGDLYHWIPLLNRFDDILEETVKKYNLKEGPQTTPWEEKDERIVCGVLNFSRMLVEECGNRSLYGSSNVSLNLNQNGKREDVLISYQAHQRSITYNFSGCVGGLSTFRCPPCTTLFRFEI
jgi:hypothetical protein